jgi:hypothetical protein
MGLAKAVSLEGLTEGETYSMNDVVISKIADAHLPKAISYRDRVRIGITILEISRGMLLVRAPVGTGFMSFTRRVRMDGRLSNIKCD